MDQEDFYWAIKQSTSIHTYVGDRAIILKVQTHADGTVHLAPDQPIFNSATAAYLAKSWTPEWSAPNRGLVVEDSYKVIDIRNQICFWIDIRLSQIAGNLVISRSKGPAIYRLNVEDWHWFYNDERHREGGPASYDGRLEQWVWHGVKHRLDGPAHIDKVNGIYQWFENGLLHRTDGPAYSNETTGEKSWYRHGKLHREDGPAVVNDGNIYWYFEDRLHRENGPARICLETGAEEWYCHGRLHRTDGPAYIDSDGNEHFYLNSIRYSKQEWSAVVASSSGPPHCPTATPDAQQQT